MNLYQHSIRVILQNQADSGAFVASPNFPSYAYCWLRDGSFIAHAMDRVGEHSSARAFLRWVAQVVRRYAWKVDNVSARLENGQALADGDYLHTRYTLAGEETDAGWWNFQLDGYGTWLWALAEHLAITEDATLRREVADSVQITVRYLAALWRRPNYDCWEEHAQYLHPYTLAAIYAGLQAATGLLPDGGQHTADVAEEIRRFVLSQGSRDGHLVKSIAVAALPADQSPASNETTITNAVDASLIGVATPYCLLAVDDPLMEATVARLEADLHRPGGGVYRYRADTYFGGGEWVLLAAWLGWHYARAGERGRARELLGWVEAQADTAGHLPEQISTHLLAPDRHAEWEARWGPVANPLLWSHAMYLILHQALKATERK